MVVRIYRKGSVEDVYKKVQSVQFLSDNCLRLYFKDSALLIRELDSCRFSVRSR